MYFENSQTASSTPVPNQKTIISMGHEDEYESLPDNYPLRVHMLAGSIAGITEHAAMYPIDVVKTQLQSMRGVPYTGVTDAFSTIVRDYGLRRMFRGMSAMVVGAGPAHALYFACYENVKKMLTLKLNGNAKNSDLANGLAGASATLFHDAVMTPAEVIKQRMQMYGSSYTSCRTCAMQIFQQEGFRAFYRSFFTSFLMNAPFQSIHFVVYEKMQVKLNHTREYSPMSHMTSGAVAGATASFLTNPLDVCKTLLNTQQHAEKSTVRGLPDAVRTVYAVNGLRTFFRGVTARVLYQSPSTAISWSVYELFKRSLLAPDAPENGESFAHHTSSSTSVNLLPTTKTSPTGTTSNSTELTTRRK